MTEGMLAGMKVVEWGNFITAPFCSKVLADWGADVIKIEAPGVGDESRHHGPFPKDKYDPEKSGLFLSLNTNKKSVTLDINEPSGREMLKRLLKRADIFVENNPPKMMKELGLDYASLKDEFPRLIMTSITPWGQTGPYRDYKGYCLNVSGVAGMALIAGSPDREPLDHPMSYCEYQAGLSGAVGSLIALFDRDNTGMGQQCDIATFQTTISYQGIGGVALYKATKQATMRSGAHALTVFYPWCILPCKDGYLCVATLDFKHWINFMEALGTPEWSKDPRFNPPDHALASLAPYIDELDALLTNELEKYTKNELWDKARKFKTPFLPVMSIEDMMNSPQGKFRNEVVELSHPKAGTLKYPGAPVIANEAPFQLRSPAPLLGQHNLEVYINELCDEEELAKLSKAGIV